MRRFVAVWLIILFLVSFSVVSSASKAVSSYFIGTDELSAVINAPRDGAVRPLVSIGQQPRTCMFECILAVENGASEGLLSVDRSAEGSAPESLVVEDDGSIAILDSVNHRINIYGPDGFAGSFALPDTSFYPVDLEETDSFFFVLDTSDTIFAIEKLSGEVKATPSPIPYDRVKRFVSMDDSILLLDDNGVSYLVYGEGPSEEIRISSRNNIGEDGIGNSYDLLILIADSHRVCADIRLVRHDETGKNRSYATLRLDDYDISNFDLYFSDNGEAYLLASLGGCTAVFRIIMGSSCISRLPEFVEIDEASLSDISKNKGMFFCITRAVNSFSKTISLCPAAPASVEKHLSREKFIPITYKDPYAKLFFRVILQAPG